MVATIHELNYVMLRFLTMCFSARVLDFLREVQQVIVLMDA